MAAVAEYYQLPADILPEVDLIRSVSPEEQLGVFGDCMDQAGFPSRPDGQALVFNVPEDQRQSHGLAKYVCTGQYPVDQRYTTPLTDEQWQAVYDFQVATTLPCIRNLGYDVSDPPTLRSYLESDDATRWDPIGEVEPQVLDDALNNGRWSSFGEFLQTCPASSSSGDLRGIKD